MIVIDNLTNFQVAQCLIFKSGEEKKNKQLLKQKCKKLVAHSIYLDFLADILCIFSTFTYTLLRCKDTNTEHSEGILAYIMQDLQFYLLLFFKNP